MSENQGDGRFGLKADRAAGLRPQPPAASSLSSIPSAARDIADMQGVNCFGIPSIYRGWSITQECDDRFYGWGPNYDADYNDEDGFVGNGECVQGCNTWDDLREEIDAYIEEHGE